MNLEETGLLKRIMYKWDYVQTLMERICKNSPYWLKLTIRKKQTVVTVTVGVDTEVKLLQRLEDGKAVLLLHYMATIKDNNTALHVFVRDISGHIGKAFRS